MLKEKLELHCDQNVGIDFSFTQNGAVVQV
jgi:hypothetical protein